MVFWHSNPDMSITGTGLIYTSCRDPLHGIPMPRTVADPGMQGNVPLLAIPPQREDRGYSPFVRASGRAAHIVQMLFEGGADRLSVTEHHQERRDCAAEKGQTKVGSSRTETSIATRAAKSCG